MGAGSYGDSRRKPLRWRAVDLLLIRHGLPLRVERDDGLPADPPLSPEGRAQAESVARWLAHESIDRIRLFDRLELAQKLLVTLRGDRSEEVLLVAEVGVERWCGDTEQRPEASQRQSIEAVGGEDPACCVDYGVWT